MSTAGQRPLLQASTGSVPCPRSVLTASLHRTSGDVPWSSVPSHLPAMSSGSTEPLLADTNGVCTERAWASLLSMTMATKAFLRSGCGSHTCATHLPVTPHMCAASRELANDGGTAAAVKQWCPVLLDPHLISVHPFLILAFICVWQPWKSRNLKAVHTREGKSLLGNRG